MNKCIVVAGLGALPLVSCQPVSQLDQLQFTQPGRQFQERGAFGNDCGITGQVESGRITSGATGGSGSC